MADTQSKSGYAAKLNILRKIDDAASQMGSQKKGGMRDIGARSTAQNVLNNNMLHKSVKKSDLARLNQNQAEVTFVPEQSEAGRSMKSEYDYGNKKKFVDVLGNVNKKNTFNVDMTRNQKGVDQASVRSKYTDISRTNGKQAGYNDQPMAPIDEFEEIRLVN